MALDDLVRRRAKRYRRRRRQRTKPRTRRTPKFDQNIPRGARHIRRILRRTPTKSEEGMLCRPQVSKKQTSSSPIEAVDKLGSPRELRFPNSYLPVVGQGGQYPAPVPPLALRSHPTFASPNDDSRKHSHHGKDLQLNTAQKAVLSKRHARQLQLQTIQEQHQKKKRDARRRSWVLSGCFDRDQDLLRYLQQHYDAWRRVRIEWTQEPIHYFLDNEPFPLSSGSFGQVFVVDLATMIPQREQYVVKVLTLMRGDLSTHANKEVTILLKLLTGRAGKYVVPLVGWFRVTYECLSPIWKHTLTFRRRDPVTRERETCTPKQDDFVYGLIFKKLDDVPIADIWNNPTFANIWTYQLVSAVAHMHAKRIVHRDLKFSNILVESQPFRLRLIDFGESQQLTKENRLPNQHCVGTLQCMSPETLLQGPQGTGVDIWSMGCLILAVFVRTRRPLEFVSARNADVESHFIRLTRFFGPKYMRHVIKKYEGRGSKYYKRPFRKHVFNLADSSEMQSESAVRIALQDRFKEAWYRCSESQQSLVVRCLLLDPAQRASARELLQTSAYLQAGKTLARQPKAWRRSRQRTKVVGSPELLIRHTKYWQ